MKRLLILLSVVACSHTTAPLPSFYYDHECDREKRAVWAALGNETPVPDQLMNWGEWNIDNQTYYFLPLREGCRVLRA